jgi:predicted secreted hydrolase
MERPLHDKTANPSPAASMSIVSGNAQYVVLGTATGHPLVVRVRDAHSLRVRGATHVAFTIGPIQGGDSGAAIFADGQLSATALIGPVEGLATSPPLVARRAGPIQVTAQLAGSSLVPKVTFDLDIITRRSSGRRLLSRHSLRRRISPGRRRRSRTPNQTGKHPLTTGRKPMTTTTALAGRAVKSTEYERLGLSPDTIAPWEDGARTDGGPGNFEWWYFDAHLDDGAALVIMFLNKDFTQPHKPLAPLVRINLDLPDGRSLQKEQRYGPGVYSAATDHADVRIAGNRFEGDLHRYRISAAIDELSVEVTLTSQVPPWRPDTGYVYFGADRSRHFAWLPSVPQGTVEARYRIGDEIHHTTGIGYHDHNWGNAPLPKLIHDWYWARGQAGPYSVITACETAHKNYGYAPITSFMLAKDGQVIAGDAAKVTFTPEDLYNDETTGKPVANVLRYSYENGADRYTVTYTRHEDLIRTRLIEGVHGVKRLAATVAGFDGAYLRFSGTCQVQYFRAGELLEEFEDKAIWELMYFGHPH